jgi:hypothetical protein
MMKTIVLPASGATNLPEGYVSYKYFGFNPTTKHRIYSNDQKTWVDEADNPVPDTGTPTQSEVPNVS